MTREPMTVRTVEEERSLGRIAQRHHQPHACLGVDPIMGVGRRVFGMLQDGVECDAALLADRLDDVNADSGSAETEAWNAALAAAEQAVRELEFDNERDGQPSSGVYQDLLSRLAALRKGASE